MKLKNKKTGQLGNFIINKDHFECVDLDYVPEYRNLAELNEEWEDYEEPRGKALYWMILTFENFIENEPDDKWLDLEDCKQMLEKLKAWKRLKDKGIIFLGYDRYCDGHWHIKFTFDNYYCTGEPYSASDDLDLLFGGKE